MTGALVITHGAGLTRPQGKRTILPVNGAGRVGAVLNFLQELPSGVETWWSPLAWERDRRQASAWRSACGVAIDVDYHAKEDLPADRAAALAGWKPPGNLMHLTPHGARVVFVFDSDVSDAATYKRAARSAGSRVSASLCENELTDFQVDEPLVEDLGRLFFAPRARAKGVQRNSEVVSLRAEPYSTAELCPAPCRVEVSDDLDDALAAFNRDHQIDFCARTCPVCSHKDCFGPLPDSGGARWFCWSTSHSGVGVRSGRGHHGDAADLECHRSGKKLPEMLREAGYLRKEPARVVSIDSVRREFRDNSYLTALTIIAGNLRGVVGGRLEYNEMSGRVEIDRSPICDHHISRIRAEIERCFEVETKTGVRGIRVSATDTFAALEQASVSKSYHPVREYLRQLQWDGVERLASVPDDLLDAARSPLNSTIIARFMVSAVARAMNPGCKVDTVPILVGKQGAGKSTWFRVLSDPWFVDSGVDIYAKESFLVLRRAWLYEWAELDVLRRARDAAAAKSFLASQVDTYRPPYGRVVVDVPRHCVIVGTTNPDEFLTDDTGNRRFWPVRCGNINLAATESARDQLWAEAVSLWRQGTPWHFSLDESSQLDAVHEEHAVTDAWDEAIWSWASGRVVEFSVAEVLVEALHIDLGRCDDRAYKRVQRSLRRGGWRPSGSSHRKARTWKSK